MQNKDLKIQVPDKVLGIIGTIEAAGYEAYAVGGCVRDSLMGLTPQDWDITTSAKPEVVAGLFKRTVDTGLKHGTLTVMLGKEGFEVTTFRLDGEYEDCRHPKSVEFTKSLEEDLKRRDFTVNAMAYHPEKGLIDLFGGIHDMDASIIRCVGEAKERFNEDALRMLRAIRFAARFGFAIEAGTEQAIKENAKNLSKVSAERIQSELLKLICSPNPDMFRIAYRCGLTKVFLPEFDRCMETDQITPYHKYSVGEHILHSLKHVRNTKILRLTMLFHDIGKPEALQIDKAGIYHFKKHPLYSTEMSRMIMKRLKFDNDTIRSVSELVRYHDYPIGVSEKGMRRFVSKIGIELSAYIFDIKRADILAKSDKYRDEQLKLVDELEDIYGKVLDSNAALTLKDLAVNGIDLMSRGIPKGPEIGRILNLMLEDVIDDPDHNSREYLFGNLEKYLESR